MTVHDDALAAYIGALPTGKLLADSNPTGRHGNLFGDAAWATDVGSINRSYITCPTHTADYAYAAFADPVFTDFSFACWWKPHADGSSSIRTLAFGGLPSDSWVNSWWVQSTANATTAATTQLNLRLTLEGVTTTAPGLSLPVDTWHHIGVSRSSAAAILFYLDGVNIDGNTGPATFPATSGITIAKNGTYRSQGGFADIGLWDRVLTPTEFATIADPAYQPLGSSGAAPAPYNPFRTPYIFGAG